MEDTRTHIVTVGGGVRWRTRSDCGWGSQVEDTRTHIVTVGGGVRWRTRSDCGWGSQVEDTHTYKRWRAHVHIYSDNIVI